MMKHHSYPGKLHYFSHRHASKFKYLMHENTLRPTLLALVIRPYGVSFFLKKMSVRVTQDYVSGYVSLSCGAPQGFASNSCCLMALISAWRFAPMCMCFAPTHRQGPRLQVIVGKGTVDITRALEFPTC
jgi:hypothetical protein